MPERGRRITRQVLLEGAAELLDRGLYGDFTVDGFARHLGMSKSTLYKHFLGKDRVVVKLVETLCEQTEGRLCALDGLAPEAAFEALERVVCEHVGRIPRALVLEHERLPAEARLRLQQTHDLLVAALGDVLEEGVDAGLYAIARPRVVAVAVIAAAEAAQREAAELRLDRTGQVHEVLSTFARGLKAR